MKKNKKILRKKKKKLKIREIFEIIILYENDFLAFYSNPFEI